MATMLFMRVENAIDKQEMKQNNEESYLMSIKNLCTNPGYWLLLITYGINVGVFYAVSTLLNDTVTKYFDYEVKFYRIKHEY